MITEPGMHKMNRVVLLSAKKPPYTLSNCRLAILAFYTLQKHPMECFRYTFTRIFVWA